MARDFLRREFGGHRKGVEHRLVVAKVAVFQRHVGVNGLARHASNINWYWVTLGLLL